jgi:circadian clock protein KaiC
MKLKRVSLEAEEAVLKVRAKSIETELVAKKIERDLLIRTAESREREMASRRERMRELRGADMAKPKRQAKAVKL